MDHAFAALDRDFDVRHPFLVQIKTDARVDVLRGDPRFDTYVERMGFPDSEPGRGR